MKAAFSGAQCSQRVTEQSLPTSSTELIHTGHAWHCKAASVCGATYFQHIYQLFLYVPLYSLLALCMNSIGNSALLSLGVSGLTLLGTNVRLPSTPQPLLDKAAELRRSLGINYFSFADEYASRLIGQPLPNPPFLSSSRFLPLLFFMMCSGGERPATPLR